ncbi:Gfo/Idh/MocA family oxidoreductase [candidate division KSB1 bacterium]
MESMDRRRFLKKTTVAAGAVMGAPALSKSFAKRKPSDTVNVAVVGINGRGRSHIKSLCELPNVKITALCDIDERLFPKTVKRIEELSGNKPKTVVDFRKLIEDKDLDAVSLATPDHWHSLHTIWACQAGKDVYVEKPVSHSLWEGRKMVEAARKYNRVVQTGTQSRSRPTVRAAVKFLHDGGLGNVYMAKGTCYKPRASIGNKKDSFVPKGVDWDKFLGPAPYRPFNQNRFHYNWHWFWDTGTTDMGNQGVHQMDIARWGLGKRVHPVKIKATGNYFMWDSDQETPNVQHVTFEYEDGALMQFEVRGLFTNDEGNNRIGNFFYGTKGWMTSTDNFRARYCKITLRPDGFSEYDEEEGPNFPGSEIKSDPINPLGSLAGGHFGNFINCVKSRRWQDLNADILEGHMSTSLCHLGNIATRLGRTLNFNPNSEQFVNDEEANSYLKRNYRYPYVIPDKV